MPITFSISADCKTMDIIGGPANAEYSLYQNDFTSPTNIYELEDPTQPYNGNIDLSDGEPINGYLVVSPPTLSGSGSATLTYQNIGSATEEYLNGVFMLMVTDPVDTTNIYVQGAIGHCDIDCCIVNKLETLLGCSCEKDCSAYLNDISKIYLLIKGATTNTLDCIQTAEQYQRAYKKYAKAKSMCSSEECNCSC